MHKINRWPGITTSHTWPSGDQINIPFLCTNKVDHLWYCVRKTWMTKIENVKVQETEATMERNLPPKDLILFQKIHKYNGIYFPGHQPIISWFLSRQSKINKKDFATPRFRTSIWFYHLLALSKRNERETLTSTKVNERMNSTGRTEEIKQINVK